MKHSIGDVAETLDVRHALRRRSRHELVASGCVLVAVAVMLFFARRAVPQAEASSIALLVLIMALVGAAASPILGLYAIVFLTLIGDSITTNWFPFAKNLSSSESLLYLSDKLTLSPLEILIGVTCAFWLINVAGSGRLVIRGPVFTAAAMFTLFVVFGFVVGVGRGGDLRIGLFEGRAIFVLFPVYVLATNLCDRGAMRRMMWLAVVAIVANALFALRYFSTLSPVQLEERETSASTPHPCTSTPSSCS